MSSSVRSVGQMDISPEDTNRGDEISCLIHCLFPSEKAMDQALEIAKKIEHSGLLHLVLGDVCETYLKLGEAGLQKAYQVAQYKEAQLSRSTYFVGQAILNACYRLNSAESLKLAEEIKNNGFAQKKSQQPILAKEPVAVMKTTVRCETKWCRGSEEMTPLQHASFTGNMDEVKLLLQQGAVVDDFCNTSDSTQRGALHCAIDADHVEIALHLISAGAKDRVASCNSFHGRVAYRLPIEHGSSSFTCLNALHMAVIKNMDEVARALLISNASKIDEKASGINTVLHLAARTGNEKMLGLLLQYVTSEMKSVKDQNRMTPKEVAQSMGHDHLLDLLS